MYWSEYRVRIINYLESINVRSRSKVLAPPLPPATQSHLHQPRLPQEGLLLCLLHCRCPSRPSSIACLSLPRIPLIDPLPCHFCVEQPAINSQAGWWLGVEATLWNCGDCGHWPKQCYKRRHPTRLKKGWEAEKYRTRDERARSRSQKIRWRVAIWIPKSIQRFKRQRSKRQRFKRQQEWFPQSATKWEWLCYEITQVFRIREIEGEKTRDLKDMCRSKDSPVKQPLRSQWRNLNQQWGREREKAGTKGEEAMGKKWWGADELLRQVFQGEEEDHEPPGARWSHRVLLRAKRERLRVDTGRRSGVKVCEAILGLGEPAEGAWPVKRATQRDYNWLTDFIR